jgi:hypothetical protein
MLFYIINMVKTEKDIKSLLGPLESGATMWESIDVAAANGEPFLSFTFQNKQIYQTVYNIN